MKRLFFILIFIFAYNFVSYGNEMQYAEDNGAYWYLKVFEFEPEFSISERNKVYEITNIEAYNELSVKGMMEGVGLKGRDNFLNLYLTPAIAAGYIRLLYPQSPRHPRQKYLLTVKGQMLYDIIMKKGGEG